MRVYSSLENLWRICFIITAASLWVLIALNTGSDNVSHLPNAPTPITVSDNTRGVKQSGFVINTVGCHIPYFDPFDPSIEDFIFGEEDPQCEETYGLALVKSNSTTLYINELALSYYNITDLTDLRCCYTPFQRVQLEIQTSGKYPKDVDNQLRFGDTCIEFTSQVKVSDEFVKTECYLKSSTSSEPIFKDVHTLIPIKTSVAKRKGYNRPNKGSVSVIVLGVDSVSRLNLHRQMPLTVEFLKHNLSAVEFLGYNKVEDNTFPNVMPVLTGLSVEELKTSCWPSEDSVFDECRFLWDWFGEVGHKTGFSEDCRVLGGLFSYLYQGFRKQPTDYYTRPFYLKAEDDIGFNKRHDSNLCLGPRKSLEVLLNYGFDFAYTFRNVLSFLFLWGSSLTHDYLNLAKRGDIDHKEFLEKLYKKNVLNTTVFVFLSDHGIRFGDIRETYQGYLEERLPFLFIAYPDWFKKKFPTAVRNLKTNAQKLTSPFDLHETLLDLANLTRLETEALKVRSEKLEKTKNLPRGISLFLPIPEERVCKDAGITDHWCTCHQSVSISTNTTMVTRAADYLVNHINSLVKDYPGCATLKLNNITNAREEKPTSHKMFNTSDFSVTVETVPGKALFESTVRYNGNTHNFTIVGIVSRINLYANQSSCISHFRLRMYCYCI